MVACPICGKSVNASKINDHIDSGCEAFIENGENGTSSRASTPVSSFFRTPAAKKELTNGAAPASSPIPAQTSNPLKRSFGESAEPQIGTTILPADLPNGNEPPQKKSKTSALDRAAPLAERMRPRTLSEVTGQPLLSRGGLLRSLIESNKIPSMILWGGPGTGKTTIARLIASSSDARFIEINSTSTGVAECKKLFTEAKNELALRGRKTIVFCDEIHRFSKTQQDVFLSPVEAGVVTLVGATTENPSFKVCNALMSRCRVFVLEKLSEDAIVRILRRAVVLETGSDIAESHDEKEPEEDELVNGSTSSPEDSPQLREEPAETQQARHPLLTPSFLTYIAISSNSDARTALNLLSLTLSLLSTTPTLTLPELKSSLTRTLVYDRAGDNHYDAISALHKSVRGSSPDAALYYLARMLASGEDPRYIARRLVVIASEDVGLADNTLLPLATATYDACEKIGMPECRINLAHCVVALCEAPKSTRSYRGLAKAMHVVEHEAGLEIPVHLRNAPTRLLKELGVGKGYKYPPDYKGGRVRQEYLPEGLKGRVFLEGEDMPGTEVDEDLSEGEKEELRRGGREKQDSRRKPAWDGRGGDGAGDGGEDEEREFDEALGEDEVLLYED